MVRMVPGLMPMQRTFMAPGPFIPMGGGLEPSTTQLKHKIEDNELKDLKPLLNKKT
jgi:mRNA m6A methyltransferase catalytic subunit